MNVLMDRVKLILTSGLILIISINCHGQTSQLEAYRAELESDTLSQDERGRKLVDMAIEYVSIDEIDNALESANDGFELLTLHKEKHLQALEDFGYVLTDNGKLVLGIEFLLRAYRLARSIGSLNREIRIQSNIGSIYIDYDQDSLALVYHRRAKSLAQVHSDTAYLKVADYFLSGIFINMNISDSAIFYLNRAYKTFLGDSNTQMLINTYNSLSLTHKANGNLDSAQFWIERSIRDELKYSEYSDLAISYFNYGRILIDKGNYRSAKVQLLKSLDKIEEEKSGNWKRNEARTFFALGQAEAGLKNFEQAYQYIVGYDSISTVYENEVVSNRIAELTASAERLRIERERDLNKFQLEKEKQKNMIIIIVSIVLVVFGAFWIYFNEQKKKTLKALAEQNQKIADQKINELLKQQEIHSLQGVLAGQETERKRIAADLHDKLGAILSMVKLHFSSVEERIDMLRSDNKEQYDKANELLDQATVEVRNISHNLVSGVLTKFGLVPALKDLKETIESTGKLKLELTVHDMTERLSAEQELQVYRIIQELIGNILKHAQATEAEIQLNRVNGNFNLMVVDNGVGFDLNEVREKGGMGLKNLEARVHKLDGKISFDTGRGAGTTVSIDIPLDQ